MAGDTVRSQQSARERFQQLGEEEQAAVLQYGLRYAVDFLTNIAIILVIGLLFRRLPECIYLSILFIPLRSLAGGIHMEGRITCLVTTISVMAAAMLLGPVLAKYPLLCIAVAAAGSLPILLLGPVDNEKKRLDAAERQQYRRRCRILLLAEILLFVLMLALHLSSYFAFSALALLLVGIAVLAGWIRNRGQA